MRRSRRSQRDWRRGRCFRALSVLQRRRKYEREFVDYYVDAGGTAAGADLGMSQSQSQSVTLKVNGSSGEARAIQVNGKSYVDIESLARITNGTLSFHGKQIVLTLPPSSTGATAASPATQPVKPEFSKEFLRAAIEAMSVVREWRIAIVNAVQNNQPVSDDWVSGYRRTAESKLSLVSVAVNTDSDRKVLPLLQTEFNNMKTLSDKYVALNNSAELHATRFI